MSSSFTNARLLLGCLAFGMTLAAYGFDAAGGGEGDIGDPGGPDALPA